MGHRARPKPTKLAGKLFRIRSELNLSQSEMIKKLGFAGYLTSVSHLGIRAWNKRTALTRPIAVCESGRCYNGDVADDEIELKEANR